MLRCVCSSEITILGLCQKLFAAQPYFVGFEAGFEGNWSSGPRETAANITELGREAFADLQPRANRMHTIFRLD